jgi:hypothetical protein
MTVPGAAEIWDGGVALGRSSYSPPPHPANRPQASSSTAAALV